MALLLCAQVVQEVDILLAQGLLLRPHLSCLARQTGLLRSKLTHGLCVLLANTKLLSCQRSDTLAQLLTQLRLLAKNIGLLPCELAI